MNIALIEDMESETKLMKKLLCDFAKQSRLSFSIDCFSNGEAFLESFEAYKYSVIFLDIFMDGMTGTEVAKHVREKDTDCIIVFLTSSDAFMPEAFSCHAFEYIQKPATPKRVFHVLEDIINFIPPTQPHIEFSCSRQNIRLLFSQILCVTADKHHTDITDIQGVTYSPNIGFSKFIESLTKDKRFLLINRGILVNMDYILTFEKSTCLLTGDIQLPVRVREHLKIKQMWQDYNFAQIHTKLREGRKINEDF